MRRYRSGADTVWIAACHGHVRGQSGADFHRRFRREHDAGAVGHRHSGRSADRRSGHMPAIVRCMDDRLPSADGDGISFTYVAAAVAICADKGYGAVVGAVLVGGLLELVLGLTARYWRRFVPPIVSAIVVTSIGFSLLTVGAESFGGGSGAEDFGSWQNLTLGLVSLVACLAFQLLMKGTASSFRCCSAWWSAMWRRWRWQGRSFRYRAPADRVRAADHAVQARVRPGCDHLAGPAVRGSPPWRCWETRPR